MNVKTIRGELGSPHCVYLEVDSNPTMCTGGLSYLDCDLDLLHGAEFRTSSRWGYSHLDPVRLVLSILCK